MRSFAANSPMPDMNASGLRYAGSMYPAERPPRERQFTRAQQRLNVRLGTPPPPSMNRAKSLSKPDDMEKKMGVKSQTIPTQTFGIGPRGMMMGGTRSMAGRARTMRRSLRFDKKVDLMAGIGGTMRNNDRPSISLSGSSDS